MVTSERSPTAPELGVGSLAWAARTLRACAMPPEGVRAVLGAGDPETVRRLLELHREWLQERLAEQGRALALVGRALAELKD